MLTEHGIRIDETFKYRKNNVISVKCAGINEVDVGRNVNIDRQTPFQKTILCIWEC
jgi:hypothetical protein